MKGAKKAVKRYEKISTTAWFTAEGRTFSDIPYSKEFFEAMKRVDAPSRLLSINHSSVSFCYIEARYKMINTFLLESRIKQILELASGFSPRGFSMAADETADYVEIDLPQVIEKKRVVLSFMSQRLPKNLHLEHGNVLKLADLKAACRHFDANRQIAVIHEGLLRYLTFDEKGIVAKNIAGLLRKFGGVWITTDVTLSNFINKENISGETRAITGIDITSNAFRDVDESKRFFESFGFSVDVHSLKELGDALVSPSKLKLSRKEVKDTLEKGYLLVMRLA